MDSRDARTWRLVGTAGAALFLAGALAFALRPALLDAADAPLAGAGGRAGLLAAGVFAFLGNVEFVGAVLILACILLAATGRFPAAVALVGVFLAEEGVVQLLKDLVARPRPEWALLAAGGWSFPSGHAARGALMAAMAVALLPAARGRAALAAAFAFGLLMAAARVVLGVHHVTDVLAGAGIGLAAAGAGMTLLLAYEEKRATVRVRVEEKATTRPSPLARER